MMWEGRKKWPFSSRPHFCSSGVGLDQDGGRVAAAVFAVTRGGRGLGRGLGLLGIRRGAPRQGGNRDQGRKRSHGDPLRGVTDGGQAGVFGSVGRDTSPLAVSDVPSGFPVHPQQDADARPASG